jgi:hypothetical protein
VARASNERLNDNAIGIAPDQQQAAGPEGKLNDFLIVLVVCPVIQCHNDTIMVSRCPVSDGCMIVDGKGVSFHREVLRRLACHGRTSDQSRSVMMRDTKLLVPAACQKTAFLWQCKYEIIFAIGARAAVAITTQCVTETADRCRSNTADARDTGVLRPMIACWSASTDMTVVGW